MAFTLRGLIPRLGVALLAVFFLLVLREVYDMHGWRGLGPALAIPMLVVLGLLAAMLRRRADSSGRFTLRVMGALMFLGFLTFILALAAADMVQWSAGGVLLLLLLLAPWELLLLGSGGRAERTEGD